MQFLFDLYDKCFIYGYFPVQWKKAIAIFFRKRNKIPSDPGAYRPISLLPVAAKILERIVKIRVMIQLESMSYLDESQHGFREGRSTVTAIKSMRTTVKDFSARFKYHAMTSLDIEGAFDRLDWCVLSALLENLPLPKYLISILKNYITDRKVGFVYTNGIKWSTLNRGTPQGSCIGPLLWILVADYILKEYKKKIDNNITAYADDFVIYAGGDTRLELERNMTYCIEGFAQVCSSINLTVSPSKSCSLLFGNKLQNRRPTFRMNNHNIKVSNKLNYLGIIIDHRFSWLHHLEAVRDKIIDFTLNIAKTGCRDSGSSADLRKTWYLLVMEKQISYGFEIWFDDLKEAGLKRLSSCQRHGLLSVTRAYRDTSTMALCVIAGVPPIDIVLRNQLMAHKTIHENLHTVIKNVDISSSNLDSLRKSSVSTDVLLFKEVRTVGALLKNRLYLGHTVFTDGSKMDSGTAAAFCVYYNNQEIYSYRIKLHFLNSIFQAEQYAIYCALRWLDTRKFRNVTIYSDSYSTIQALLKLFPSNDLLYKIQVLLNKNYENNIQIGWVKAHVGIIGNERADTLAKEAIVENKYEDTAVLDFPISVVKSHYKTKIISDWQTEWTNSEKGRDTYSIIRKVDKNYLCRRQIIIYYLTGHGSFPSFLYKIGKKVNPDCLCGELGNVHHYLFGRCPYMLHHFRIDRNRTLRENYFALLHNSYNYSKLKDNYNILNDNFSFIRKHL